MKNIEIKPRINGWAVTVGCSTAVFQSKTKMLNEISRYIDSPEEVAKEYAENSVNEQDNDNLVARRGTLSATILTDDEF